MMKERESETGSERIGFITVERESDLKEERVTVTKRMSDVILREWKSGM